MLAYYNIRACLDPADPVLIVRWPVQDMEMMTSFCTGKSDMKCYKNILGKVMLSESKFYSSMKRNKAYTCKINF